MYRRRASSLRDYSNDDIQYGNKLFESLIEKAEISTDNIYDALTIFSSKFRNTDADRDEEIDKLIKIISDYTGIRDNFKLIAFSMIFRSQLQNGTGLDVYELASALNLEDTEIISRRNVFDEMVEDNLLEENLNARNPMDRFAEYMVPQYIENAILTNTPINWEEGKYNKTMSAFIKKFYDISGSNENENSMTVRTLPFLERKWHFNDNIAKITTAVDNPQLRCMLYTLAAEKIIPRFSRRRDQTRLFELISRFFPRPKERLDMCTEFLEGKNILQTSGFIKLDDAKIFDQTEIQISDAGLEFILGDESKMFLKKMKSNSIIYSESITEKTLFYSGEMERQLDTLYKIFDKENFVLMQKRLEAKNLCRGVAVMLYGEPGTGKTESVYQIARKTGRNIIHVDISEAKSCWLGQSQKQIKKIFTDYNKQCKDAIESGEQIPVLLLNEADGIISKRKDSNSSGVAQEENAMQNILLEEIENLEGILIATTNLPDNLDGAFERRFLFKIKYEKPDTESRAKIWKSKLEFLKEEEALELAENYQFTGGEIDNIVRKSEIDEILTGTVPDLDAIKEICRHEKFNDSRTRCIGFGD